MQIVSASLVSVCPLKAICNFPSLLPASLFLFLKWKMVQSCLPALTLVGEHGRYAPLPTDAMKQAIEKRVVSTLFCIAILYQYHVSENHLYFVLHSLSNEPPMKFGTDVL